MKITIFMFLFSCTLFAQDTLYFEKKIDSLYREDQFYFGFTYNLFQNKPSGISQDGFSTGLHLGFLRDMPINKNRTMAVAVGFGFAYQAYNQNLLISKNENTYTFTRIDNDVAYKKNQFSFINFDLPIELRWRTSTPESHKFFRLYTGIKLSYMLYNNSRFIASEGNIKINNNENFNAFQYGVYLATGYNTWNFYAYYGLNTIFKSEAKFEGRAMELSTLNLGLQFYIL
ncbi:PorT family protein [Flavobacterium piscinae]|uniref:PorT family protein n=1 Tax=Flavobacterium piscinae TaxID=2506424 RepID=A0A4Q1L127_9FLAO|nr:porin family protein [Flavobacterium piscinae]RXR35384.1 PorT family protein [Flavobacterium piscinae]